MPPKLSPTAWRMLRACAEREAIGEERFHGMPEWLIDRRVVSVLKRGRLIEWHGRPLFVYRLTPAGRALLETEDAKDGRGMSQKS